MTKLVRKLLPQKTSSSIALHVVFLALAAAGAYFASFATPFQGYFDILIIPIIVGVVLYFIYTFTWQYVRSAFSEGILKVVICALLAIFFSCALVLGAWYSADTVYGKPLEYIDVFTGEPIWDAYMHSSLPDPISWMDLLAIVVNSIPIFFVCVYAMSLLDRISTWANRWKGQSGSDAVVASASYADTSKEDSSAKEDSFAQPSRSSALENRFSHPVKTYFAFAGILLVLWIPVYLAAYPGFFCYDMSYGDLPMWQQYSVWEFVNHHPVIQTLVMGFIIDTVSNLTGSFNDGVAVYVALQNVLLAFVFATMVFCIDRTLRSKAFTICTLAYLVLNPLVVMFVDCTAKDTLFSAFVVLNATTLFAAMRSGVFRSKAAFQAADTRFAVLLLACLVVSGVGVCILRLNGIIAFVLNILVIAICARGAYERVIMAGACCGALVVSLLWLGPGYSLINVKDNPLEGSFIYSIPSQQISYVLERDNATEEELQLAEDLHYIGANSYMPKLADSSKGKVADMSFGEVMQLYLALGAAHPQAYFFVFIEQTQGLWNPYALDKVYLWDAYEDRETSLFAFDWERPAHSDSKFPALTDYLEKVSTENFLQRVPVLSLFVTLAFYSWLLLVLIARCVITRDRRVIGAASLLFFVSLSAFFGPCVLARYYLCLIFGLPLMAMLLVASKRQEQRDCA